MTKSQKQVNSSTEPKIAKRKFSSSRTCMFIGILYCIMLFIWKYSDIYCSNCYFVSLEDVFSHNSFSQDSRDRVQDGIQQIKTYPRWKLEKTVWIFDQVPDSNRQKQLVRLLNLQNTNHFLKQNDYSLIFIDPQNLNANLSPQMSKKLMLVKEMLETRLQNCPNNVGLCILNTTQHKQLKENKHKILRHLLVYSTLLQNGGIYMDQSVTILQSFTSWLQDIMNVHQINVGDKLNVNIEPKCFGFFDLQYSSLRSKVNIKRQYSFQKKIVRFPTLQEYFIACTRQNSFLKQLLETYIQLLTNPKQSEALQRLNKHQNLIGKINPAKIYEEGHLISQQIVLQRRQNLLDTNSSNNKYRKLAIDDYGLITINRHLGPSKIKSMFEAQNYKSYSFLSKLSMDQIQFQTGPFRFVMVLDEYIKWFFGHQLIYTSSPGNFIMENSFFYRYYLTYMLNSSKEELKSKYSLDNMPQFLPQIYQDDDNQENSQWQSLNKNVWIIWSGGINRKSNTLVELCLQNLKQSAQNSGFKLHQVNQKNIHEFLDKQILQRINYAVHRANTPVSPQTISDIWRVALIHQHGGVYVDASTIQVDESFDWILNVTRISSKFLWNRYGNQPQVLLAWNAYYGSPTNWTIDKVYKTKTQNQLSFENNFIAAVKGSEFIKQWLDVFLQWIPLTYSQVESRVKNIGVFQHRWISHDNLYLLAMESLKYVIARRQKLLQQQGNKQYQNSMHYYKIWSLLGQMFGQQKIRGETNFQMKDYRVDMIIKDIYNVYKDQYSLKQSESIMGPLAFQVKFFSFDTRMTYYLMQNFYDQRKYNFSMNDFREIIHPQSFLGRKLLMRYQNKTLSSLKFYSNSRIHKIAFSLGL